MILPYDKSAAVVALPALVAGAITDVGLRHWLSQASVCRTEEPRELLKSVLEVLNLPTVEDGIAALRMWGQTGDRPSSWLAAADPVYLEARLEHLCMHALYGDNMSISDLRAIFDHLQDTLADDGRYDFARIGGFGYLRATDPLATASYPAINIDQQLPNDYMPSGDATGSYRSLRSEVEMALHDHAVNVRRETEGLPPVNSLWLWGGGFAPEQNTEPHPPLFASEPVLKGYWLSKTGVVGNWPGSIAACLEASVAGFVAVPGPEENDAGRLERCLHDLRTALRSGRISKLILILADGYVVRLQRSDAWRIWRRWSSIFRP